MFFKTNNPEVDALTILCMQLVLRNHLIFERQSTMYLAEGEFSGHDKEKEHVRNCPQTNRPCESNMGFLDREMTIRPNATPGYLEASIIVQNNGLKSIGAMEDKEKSKAFAIAREWASEVIKQNKEQLKYHIAARKAIIQSKELAGKDKEKWSVARRSKIVSDLSRYGNEWKNEDDMKRFLESANTEAEKVNAVQAQIRYHKHILGTDTVMGKEGKNLFKLTNIGLEQLCENLKKIISQSPSYEFLDEIRPSSTERISGATILSREKRKELYEQRVAILKDKLEKEREKDKHMELRVGLLKAANQRIKTSLPLRSSQIQPSLLAGG